MGISPKFGRHLWVPILNRECVREAPLFGAPLFRFGVMTGFPYCSE